MNSIAIEKIREPQKGALSVFTEMEKVADAVRRRAFEHFLGRGSTFGSDMDDWLRAERELIWSPGAEMTEHDNDLTLRVEAPGFEPGDIKITATPESLLIEGEVRHKHEASNDHLHFCEFAQTLLRRFDMPGAIDVDKVSATLDKGILKIVAPKAQAAPRNRTVPVNTPTNAAA
ncbi:MAG TPA: Hsp20 family protein [Candidatus Acidoferrales bacterium]|nr:Hsp20 family protein [Candidatus Acidoferrales bacterium]